MNNLLFQRLWPVDSLYIHI